jgi:5-methyltetrahydropteroyltriglutamate--homocysteine methyltransferase
MLPTTVTCGGLTVPPGSLRPAGPETELSRPVNGNSQPQVAPPASAGVAGPHRLANMAIPTEPIGSVPRPAELLAALAAHAEGRLDDAGLARAGEAAVRDTIELMEATGSPVVSDGEQGKPSFATYPLAGAANLAPDGATIPFADGHTRTLPRLTAGPFRYQTYADAYLRAAQRHATVPVKQAVIAPSALSLLYPAGGVDGYPRAEFLADLVDEAEADIRRSLQAGAHVVQIDFTEGRLALKLDPGGGLLADFLALIGRVLERFTPAERARIGLHTCPGSDQDSTHSLDVDYTALLPALLQVDVGNYYLQLASEADPDRVLATIKTRIRPGTRVFLGVTDPIDPRVESAEEVRDRLLRAARQLPPDQLGSCDDCGFAPFADDTSTARETAFAKMRARVDGTRLAAQELGR